MFQLCHNLQCETGYFAPCAWEVFNFAFLTPKISLNLTPRLIFVIINLVNYFAKKTGEIRCNSITKDRFVKFIGPVCTPCPTSLVLHYGNKRGHIL